MVFINRDEIIKEEDVVEDDVEVEEEKKFDPSKLERFDERFNDMFCSGASTEDLLDYIECTATLSLNNDTDRWPDIIHASVGEKCVSIPDNSYKDIFMRALLKVYNSQKFKEVYAYKVVDKDLCAFNGFQFEVGKTYTEDIVPVFGSCGFHYFTSLGGSDVAFRGAEDIVLEVKALVEAERVGSWARLSPDDPPIKKEDGARGVTNHIEILRIIPPYEYDPDFIGRRLGVERAEDYSSFVGAVEESAMADTELYKKFNENPFETLQGFYREKLESKLGKDLTTLVVKLIPYGYDFLYEPIYLYSELMPRQMNFSDKNQFISTVIKIIGSRSGEERLY